MRVPEGMEAQFEVLRRLAVVRSPLLERSFCLAGGTALALQIMHRISEDLDFFSVRPLQRLPSGEIRDLLEAVFPGEGDLRRVRTSASQEDWLALGIRVTFVAYGFPPAYPLRNGVHIDRRLEGLLVASPPEIAVMKAYAMGRRATFRDYVDLYCLFRGGHADLGEVVRGASAKYRYQGEPLFSGKLFYEQLVYVEDAAEDPATEVRMLDGACLTAGDVQDFFRDLVSREVRRELGRNAEEGLEA